jgi:MinD-like ATPase involved in chromosome partitioning or flagellar assembly
MAIIPDDPEVEQADLKALPVSLIPEKSPARTAVRELAGKILALARQRQGNGSAVR